MKEYATNDEALAGLVDRVFLKSQKYQAQQMRATYMGAHPDIILFSAKLVRRMAQLGVPMFPHCVVRPYAQQLTEFREGNSKDSPADGKWPHRRHAVDLIHGTRAWSLTPKQWAIVGHEGFEVAKAARIKVTWGGDDPGVNDKFNWDPAHWELTNWKTLE